MAGNKMSDKQPDKNTEEEILQAARRVFIRRGYDGARMQEIANEAGYNKSMLHYYYRSKDRLFHEVFIDVVRRIIPPLLAVLEENLDLMKKLEKMINKLLESLEMHPYVPGFMTRELNQHPERISEMIEELGLHMPELFIRQVRTAVRAGKIIPIHPVQLLINVLALCIFPYIGGPMVRGVTTMSEEEYNRLLKERKKLLPQFIHKALQPI